MFRSDFLAALLEVDIIEIGEIARRDPDGADAEPGFACVDAAEIDQPFQRLAAVWCRSSSATAGCPAATAAPAENAE